ncbi:MAG: hypothetical protein KJ729_07835 [Euryarchaeota archaeon]|nr:hypothetical protein [Euryarchaeota archaeon]
MKTMREKITEISKGGFINGLLIFLKIYIIVMNHINEILKEKIEQREQIIKHVDERRHTAPCTNEIESGFAAIYMHTDTAMIQMAGGGHSGY